MARYVLTPSHTYGHDLLRRLLPAILALVLPPFARMSPRVMGGLSNKIVGSQHHGSAGLGLLLEELTRCSLFNYFAQPHKLIHALIWFYAAPTFKMVHRRGANRAQNYFSLIEHRELNDRPIEVVTLNITLLQRHCKCSISEGFHCATARPAMRNLSARGALCIS